MRERGYARVVGEIEAGLNGVAAPIRNAGGQVIAAISAGGPAYRVTSARMNELSEMVVGAAASISARLGYSEQ